MKKSILLVEDSKNISLMIEKCLKNRGFHVDKAEDGVEAMVKIFQERPELILLDIMLPKLSGTAVCQAIKSNAELSKIPIIIMSARTEESQIDSVILAGADGYILKPFTPHVLISKIEEYLCIGE